MKIKLIWKFRMLSVLSEASGLEKLIRSAKWKGGGTAGRGTIL